MSERPGFDPIATVAELPPLREPHAHLARVRKRRYLLYGAALAVFFALPFVDAVRAPRPPLAELELYFGEHPLRPWRDRIGNGEVLSREARVPLADLYSADATLASIRRLAVEQGTGGARGPGLIGTIEIGGWHWTPRPASFFAAFAGFSVAGLLYLRRRLHFSREVIEYEQRKNEDMQRTFSAKIRELTEANRALESARAQLVSAEKLASIGRLSATLAHEIRNPLTIIQTSAGFIADELPEGSSAAEALELINAEIVRLNGIITDLLNFARPKPPRLVRADLNATVRTWLPPLEEELLRRGIALRFEPGVALPEAHADLDQLYQVLLNILWNARDALVEDGTEAPHIAIRTIRESARFVAIEIEDNGPGMTKEQLEQIGEPFYTTKTQGTGLGLPLCMQLLEGMGGELRVDSRVEEWTKVSLVLAVAPARDSDSIVAQPTPVASPREKDSV